MWKYFKKWRHHSELQELLLNVRSHVGSVDCFCFGEGLVWLLVFRSLLQHLVKRHIVVMLLTLLDVDIKNTSLSPSSDCGVFWKLWCIQRTLVVEQQPFYTTMKFSLTFSFLSITFSKQSSWIKRLLARESHFHAIRACLNILKTLTVSG